MSWLRGSAKSCVVKRISGGGLRQLTRLSAFAAPLCAKLKFLSELQSEPANLLCMDTRTFLKFVRGILGAAAFRGSMHWGSAYGRLRWLQSFVGCVVPAPWILAEAAISWPLESG